ncbi:MAG: hypothetical protein MUF06_07240 [Pirellulaceae bacterium]|jgi:ribosomal protein L37AE/L43A|nr:hypothetical protein [Pirellulaceae bacterium]
MNNGDTLPLTPLRYKCPACALHHQMMIEPKAWVCPHCFARLVPADINPLPPPSEAKVPAADRICSEQ